MVTTICCSIFKPINESIAFLDAVKYSFLEFLVRNEMFDFKLAKIIVWLEGVHVLVA